MSDRLPVHLRSQVCSSVHLQGRAHLGCVHACWHGARNAMTGRTLAGSLPRGATSLTSLKPMNLSGSKAGGGVGDAASACAVLACNTTMRNPSEVACELAMLLEKCAARQTRTHGVLACGQMTMPIGSRTAPSLFASRTAAPAEPAITASPGTDLRNAWRNAMAALSQNAAQDDVKRMQMLEGLL